MPKKKERKVVFDSAQRVQATLCVVLGRQSGSFADEQKV